MAISKTERLKAKLREEAILQWLAKQKTATREQTAEFLGCSAASAAQIMSHLARRKKIGLIWSGRKIAQNRIYDYVMPDDPRVKQPDSPIPKAPFWLAKFWPLPFKLPIGKPRTVKKGVMS